MNKPWPKIRLGDICHFVKGTSPTLKTLPGEYPLVVTAEFRRTADSWQIEGPAVCIPLISSTGHGDAALHRVHYQDGKFALANLLVALLPKNENKLFAKYLYHLLMVKKNELLVPLMLGTANVSLKQKDIAGVEIPLPSLAEQRRIVARIEELSAQLTEAKTLRKQAIEEAKALNVSLLFGLLPKSAPIKPLGAVIAPGNKISYGVLVPGPDVEDGIPFVRIQDLAIRNPPNMPAKRIAITVDACYRRTRLSGGEILIGVVGSIGKVGVAPASWAGANIARAVCRIVPDKSVDRDYLAMVLIAQPSQDYFREVTRTLAQPTLNVGQLSKTPIPVPPLTEQRRIVAELDALQAQVDALKRLQAETEIELNALLPSILDRAFKGEL